MNYKAKIPPFSDPRWTVVSLQIIYIILGITILGFNRDPIQIITIITFACIFDMFLAYVIRKEILFPLSAAITGCGLSILVNYSHGIMVPLIPVFFAISSKYIITANGKHVVNPALFGVVAGLFIGGGMITPSPSYQWGGTVTMALFVITAALLLFVKKIHRNTLIISFVLLYITELAIRSVIIKDIIPPHMLFLGALTNPAFYLFTFFMITDPVTSPNGKLQQFIMALIIVIVDLLLHIKQSYATLFYAGFTYFMLNWLYLHTKNILNKKLSILLELKQYVFKLSIVTTIGFIGFFGSKLLINNIYISDPEFMLTKINTKDAGITTNKSNILNEVDPRLQNVAKWLLSVGDAVAVADANNDGLMDMFLTYTLKSTNDRAALYLNKGNYKFERFELPEITKRFSNSKYGVVSGALWFDHDNDGDQDLLILTGFGKPILLNNMLIETGNLKFIDITSKNNLDTHNTTSLTANVFDMNKDGKLDIIIGNAVSYNLKGYEQNIVFNIFDLPEANNDDRRIYNFMHRTWHNAANGGIKNFYLNTKDGFVELDSQKLGLNETRWSLSIGTADFNNDGWTDLYIANDFGPDELLINNNGNSFQKIKGQLPHHIGRDVYKSMNSSIADFDNNGYLDIYTSNVHHKLQAEGSQLWLNYGNLSINDYKAFKDQATYLNALNENRFGWGAAVGDINLDGKVDIVQANGMVNDSYDKKYNKCPDYWYYNEKIALTNPNQHGYSDNWADLRGRCIFPDELNRIYINYGDRFIDIADKVGMTKKGTYRGVALVDLNNEGHLDIIVTDQFDEVSIYKNNIINNNSWVGINLVGNGINCSRDAIGTKVTLEYTDNENNTKTQIQEKHAANGFSAQGDPRLIVGLGNYNNEKITAYINWCGNNEAKIVTLNVNSYNLIRQ